jgi:hypothetical protein
MNYRTIFLGLLPVVVVVLRLNRGVVAAMATQKEVDLKRFKK